MSLEGRLRDLALAEVLQLLSASRKTGALYLDAPLQALHAVVHVQHGSVVDVRSWTTAQGASPAAARGATEARAVEAELLELLLWRDGAFRFAPASTPATEGTAVRLAIEPVLMEAAQRADVWARIEDLVPNARVVLAFVDIEPQQLPLLRLSPLQWEILTRVDGTRELRTLAELLGRDLLELAEQVHGLINAGLLTIREGPLATRHNPTPPAVVAVQEDVRRSPLEAALLSVAGARGDELAPRDNDDDDDDDDLWIPSPQHMRLASPPRAGSALKGEDNTLFDPVEVGVTSADGLPRHRTPLQATRAVASRAAEPSMSRGESTGQTPRWDTNSLVRLGDEAARRGDFRSALEHWNSALRSPEPTAQAERLRESIALTERLHALLHP